MMANFFDGLGSCIAFKPVSLVWQYFTSQVCNHPDLFEGRPIVSAFDFGGIEVQMPSLALNAKEREVWCKLDFRSLRLLPCRYESMSQWEAATVKVQRATSLLWYIVSHPSSLTWFLQYSQESEILPLLQLPLRSHKTLAEIKLQMSRALTQVLSPRF